MTLPFFFLIRHFFLVTLFSHDLILFTIITAVIVYNEKVFSESRLQVCLQESDDNGIICFSINSDDKYLSNLFTMFSTSILLFNTQIQYCFHEENSFYSTLAIYNLPL